MGQAQGAIHDALDAGRLHAQMDSRNGGTRMAVLTVETPDALKEFVGKEIGASEWLVVKQERINEFAEATEDRQWIHTDRERAKRESPFGRTVAHGFLTLSLISRFIKDVVQIGRATRLVINYGLNRVRFPSPVCEGSKIRGRFTLLSFQDLGEAQEALFTCSVECEGSSKPCCVAEWIIRYYK
jgi:acyl dehydratase